MNSRLEVILSTTLTICTLVVASTYVYRHVIAGSNHDGLLPKPSYVENWDQLLRGGTRIGTSSAAVQIVEFGDFQCPFCRLFHEGVDELMDELGDQISLVYYHYPLDIHPSAAPAALAAQCAAIAGRFKDMADELFSKQDSLGLRSWLSYARSAGITDTAGFGSCMQDSASQAMIDANKALAQELEVTGTPTVMINGWRFAFPPTVDSLRHYVGEILDGRSPFPGRQ